MIFPLRDEIKTHGTPYVTYSIIALNGIAWCILQSFGNEPDLSESICKYGFVPGNLLETISPGEAIRLSENMVCRFWPDADFFRLITSMFMHGGWMHIIGNMWFLWVFGDNVEEAMGPLRFALFYILAGVIAAFFQAATDTSSVIPMVGASGAIGGVMGAYALLYPRHKIHTLVLFFVIRIPAVFVLGWWFMIQFLSGLPHLGANESVAFWAHIGGFLSGLIMATLLRRDKHWYF
ncbi:MAG TPA: rhomboid family intramembrane serine protease [Gammaproteobacteria bacterium]|nr:rhomboid family intramembrane serine protease [Gammaproteobacteria bacterium]|tara:strand:- start:1499 stop:2203 length:705 start_codon:yes stop_codon:yes gene_type:complete